MYFTKFDGQEYYSTQEFHNDRDAVDHVNDEGHRPRIELAAQWANQLVRANPELTIIDYGAGTGGLLSLIETDNKTGYDFTPANVEFAQNNGRDVFYKDFVNSEREYSDIAIITECLEHLDDPLGFIKSLEAEWLIMSMPVGETNEAHYEYHTHGADEEGVKVFMLIHNLWEPIMEQNIWGTQLWLARKFTA